MSLGLIKNLLSTINLFLPLYTFSVMLNERLITAIFSMKNVAKQFAISASSIGILSRVRFFGIVFAGWFFAVLTADQRLELSPGIILFRMLFFFLLEK